MVNDLRRQLAEERLARSLGVPAGVGLETPDFPEADDLDDISAEAMAEAADSYSLSAVASAVASSVHTFGYDPLGQLMDV